MNSQNLQQLIEVMEEMVSLELALANLYQTCGEAFPEDLHFWLAIKHQEELHADSIRKMIVLVSARPQDFAPGRAFNATAIRTIKNGILEHVEALKRRQISRIHMLMIARDIEGSVLEAHYRDIVKTANVQFVELIDRVDHQTMEHKNLLIKKIALVNG